MTTSLRNLGELIDDYGNNYQGKDKSVPAKLAYWKDRLGEWKVSEVTRQVVAAGGLIQITGSA